MVLGEAMIVAGIGCRSGATAARIVGLVRLAIEHHGLSPADLGLLTTGEIKRNESGIAEAANLLNVPLLILDDARLRAVAAACLTSSAASMKAAGVPSLSEAAAIAGAGASGKLLGPRLAGDGVTCALSATSWSRLARNAGISP